MKKLNRIKQCLIFLSCFMSFNFLDAVEIPLEGLDGSRKVAYVNMHKIFEAFPETENARMELNKLIDEKKLEISARKEEIVQLKTDIEILKKNIANISNSTAAAEKTYTETSPHPVALSTPAFQVSLSSPPTVLQKMLREKEAILYGKEADLDAFVGVSEEEIKNMEEGKTMTLLAKIYTAVERIAAEEGYSIIVDKSNILYGEGTVDITELVLSKLRRL